MSSQSIPMLVKQARHQDSWTQAELAERAGVSRPTVARLEAGQDVSVRSLTAVLSALGLELHVQVRDHQD